MKTKKNGNKMDSRTGTHTNYLDHLILEQIGHDLDRLKSLVNISSQSQDIRGVHKAQNFIAEELESLGFKNQFIPNMEFESADLLVSNYNVGAEETLTFIGHTDTVLAPQCDYKFEVDKKHLTATGPGVSDDKAGLITALRAIRSLLSENLELPFNLCFVSSPNEELGSLGFHHVFKQIGENSKYVFGLEPALEDGSIINSRNGNRWYHINVKGLAAHSGRFGHEHVNAAHELSLKISRLMQLNDEKNRKRVNVGSFVGGAGHYNIICGEAYAKLDVRFPCHDTRDELHRKIEEIIYENELSCVLSAQQCQSTYMLEDDCPALAFRVENQLLLDRYISLINKKELTQIDHTFTGGAADINYFATKDNFYMDGLGPIGKKMHTREEKVDLFSLLTRSESLKEFIIDLAKEERASSNMKEEKKSFNMIKGEAYDTRYSSALSV